MSKIFTSKIKKTVRCTDVKNLFIQLFLTSVICFYSSALFAAEQDSVKQTNVVFVLVDQWRASAFGHTGDPNVKTPEIDKLSSTAMRFTNAVSVCPVCTPYRASLMTGRFPTSTGMFMNDLYLPDKEYCMGEMFAANGYDTAYIGKWHLDGHGRSSYIPPERRQGFEYWKAAECDHNYNDSHYYAGNSDEMRKWNGYDSFAQTKDAIEYMKSRQENKKPFLLFISYGTPHFPHETAPDEYKALYDSEKIQLPPNVPEQFQAAAKRELVGYYAHCTALDKCFTDLMNAIQSLGLSDDTIVVLTSDHGEMMGAHGVRPLFKQWFFDESAHVPLMIWLPDKASRDVMTPITTPDILPTLLSLAKLPVPDTIEGEDISSVIVSNGVDYDRSVLTMSVSPFIPNMPEFRAVRTNRYTYVETPEGTLMLFDNQNDPWQMQNLADTQQFTGLREKLKSDLKNQLDKIGDTFHTRDYYLDKWKYTVLPDGNISYGPGAKVQSPAGGL
ncbi:MAG: sulfatase family protein [Thermoguttaceae bacterium]